jgi:hypothetical protein
MAASGILRGRNLLPRWRSFLNSLDLHVHFEGRFAIGYLAAHRAGAGHRFRRRRPGPSVWLLQRRGSQHTSLLLLRFQSKNWAFECQAVPRSELIHTPDNPKKREKMV